jgi:hypothetical protein
MINLKPVRHCVGGTGPGSKGSQWIWARKVSRYTAANTSVRVLCSSCRPPATAALPFASLPQIAKYVVALGEDVAPTDIEEGMRVGVDRVKYSIMLPLPPKIDPRQVPCLAFSPPPALSTPSLTTFSVSPCVQGWFVWGRE